MFAVTLMCFCFGCKDGHTLVGHHISEYFDNEGVVSLSVAAAKGNVAEVRRLVGIGVDVNLVGEDQITPLWWAYMARSEEGFKSLLEHGADPNVQDDKGRSIMCFAAGDKESEYLRLALAFKGDPSLVSKKRNFREPTPVFCAAGEGNIENVKALIRAGGNLDYQEYHKETALMYAANLNQWGVVHALLEGGADYTIRDNWNYTIVYQLENNGISKESDVYQWRQKVVEFLRERGVKVNPKIP
jgi:ankyrin repeat protein